MLIIRAVWVVLALYFLAVAGIGMVAMFRVI